MSDILGIALTPNRRTPPVGEAPNVSYRPRRFRRACPVTDDGHFAKPAIAARYKVWVDAEKSRIAFRAACARATRLWLSSWWMEATLRMSVIVREL